MVKVLVNDTSLSSIGDSIRAAKGIKEKDRYLYKEFEFERTFTLHGYGDRNSVKIYVDDVLPFELFHHNIVKAEITTYYDSDNVGLMLRPSNIELWTGDTMSSAYNGGALYFDKNATKGYGEGFTNDIGYFDKFFKLPWTESQIEGKTVKRCVIAWWNLVEVQDFEIEITIKYKIWTDWVDEENPATNYLPSEMAGEIDGILNGVGDWKEFTIKRTENINQSGEQTLIVPEGVKEIGYYALSNLYMEKLILPQSLRSIPNQGAFQACNFLTELTIPSGVTNLGGMSLFNACSKLTDVTILCPKPSNVSTNMFTGSSVLRTWVPTANYNDWNAWGNCPGLKCLHDSNLEELIISGSSQFNIFTLTPTSTAQFTITYNALDNAFDEQRGITWSCSGNATIDQSGLLTFSGSYSVGDIITVYATSNYDNSIVGTKTLEAVYITKANSISGTDYRVAQTMTPPTADTMYESNSNYKVGNGIAKTRLTFLGYNKLVLYIYSDGESTYDYIVASKLDQAITATSWTSSSMYTQTYIKNYTRSRQKQWIKLEYTADSGEHFIDLWYGKDSSGDTGNDRGYFYVSESESE